MLPARLHLHTVVCAALVSLGALLPVTLAFAAGAAPAAAATGGPGSLSGLWVFSQYKGSGRGDERSRIQRTTDGSLPPLLPAAAAVLESRIRAAEQGSTFANTLTHCLPGGMPLMIFGAPYPVQILETAGQVTMLYEEQNHFRIIHLNGRHPDDPDPTFMGHSIGHWEGDALVVDTVGLTDRTTIDQVGMPHSEALHVVERFRRTDKGTLDILVTIDDPMTFSKPWNASAIYKSAQPGVTLNEYICENNRNEPDAKGTVTFGMPGRK
jgi:hypothetical protein